MLGFSVSRGAVDAIVDSSVTVVVYCIAGLGTVRMGGGSVIVAVTCLVRLTYRAGFAARYAEDGFAGSVAVPVDVDVAFLFVGTSP